MSRDIKHSFHKAHEHIFAYGCDAIDILGGVKPGGPAQSNQLSTSQMVSGTASMVNLNMDFRSIHYFQGSLSLPMMFTKQESDKQTD